MLAEAEYQEQDRRRWLLAQKFTDPVATYIEMRDRIEQAIDADLDKPLDEQPDISEQRLAWYRAT